MTLDDLLARWLDKEGGAERANYQMFLTEFAQALACPRRAQGRGARRLSVRGPGEVGSGARQEGHRRIDLYKRNCFVLEAKQSQLRPGEAPPLDPPAPPPVPVLDLFGVPIGFEAPSGKPAPRYDRLMADARLQAERYALALPDDHRSPPFLIVADIGRSFELYFDWSGNGRGYAAFPDERSYRIGLAELRDPEIADRFRGIWNDPAASTHG
jgi:hypothetical protein